MPLFKLVRLACRRPITTLLSLLIVVCCTMYAARLAEADEFADLDALGRAIAAARPLEVELLGEPPQRSVRFDSPLLVPNPDGATFDVLLTYYRGYQGPARTMIVDLGSGKTNSAEIPAGTNVHLMGHVIGENGKLYWALQTTQGVHLWVYDPATNELSPHRRLDEQYYGQTNRLTIATDGKIVGTVGHRGEGKAGVFEIDPATGDVTDHGPAGPLLPGSPYAMGLAADARYAYFAYGRTPWRLIAYDRQAGTADELLTLPAGGELGVRQLRDGCIATVSQGKRGGQSREYWLHGGRMIAREGDAPPWQGSLEPRPQPGQGIARPLFDLTDADPTSHADGSAVLRFRDNAAHTWKEVRWTPPTYAMAVTMLATLPDGRILGGNHDRGGYFFFDPETEQFTPLGRIPLEHGAAALVNGRFYFAGYPGGLMYEFDPARPWTASFAESKFSKDAKSPGGQGGNVQSAKLQLLLQKRQGKNPDAAAATKLPDRFAGERFGPFTSQPDADSNPRLIGQLRAASGMHRVLAAAVGADDRVYVGGAWYRDGKAGALAWYDPETRRVDGLWEPLATNQVVDLTAAGENRYIVVSTMLVSDVVTGKQVPETAKLFVFDTHEQRFVRQIAPPIPCTSTGLVAAGSGNIVMALMRDPTRELAYLLYGVDIETGETVYQRTLAAPPATKAGGQPTLRSGFVRGPDAHVWMMHEGGLLRINPDNGAVEIMGRLIQEGNAYKASPSDHGRIAFSGDDLYLAGEDQLRRIKNIVSAR